MQPTRRGFTLVELMVVIAIIGMLATVVAVGVVQQVGPAKGTKARADFLQIKQATDLFKVHHSRVPRTIEELVHPPQVRSAPEFYLEYAPQDPWGNAYVYEARGGRVEITSYGADGARGGEGEDADILASEVLGRRSDQ